MAHQLRCVTNTSRIAFLPILMLANCGSQPTQPDFDGPQILFVGNSLTYFNDLPGIVSAMIDSAGAEPVYIESLALPDFGLQDHWNTGARDRIASRSWDVVILQQGPSATEGRPSLLEYSVLFHEDVVKGGGRTAMYMVWPASSRDFDFDGVSESYRMAAEQFGGLLYPAGEAWRDAWELDADLPLYGPDGFHPGQLGSYLAGLVIFEQLTGLAASTAPNTLITAFDGVRIDVPGTTAGLLQMAASTANEDFALP